MAEVSSEATAAELAAKYSCVVCHKRKVKCNRAQPCSNCEKNNIACEYIQPPAPRRKRKQPSEDNTTEKLKKAHDSTEKVQDSPEKLEEKRQRTTPSADSGPSKHHHQPSNISPPFKTETGSLFIDAGKARYVSNSLWMTISDELPNSRPFLQQQLETSTEDEFETDEINPNNILFSGKIHGDVAALYPRPAEVMAFWRCFKENVDPLTRVIHIPTVQNLMERSCQNVRSISRNNLALLFSIHLIAVESISDEQCRATSGIARSVMLKRLNCATQQCFIKGGLLSTNDLTMLTAFLLYVLAIRITADAHTVSALMALAVRTGHRIGLHCDITDGLRPYDIEMRRRVWKQTILQDWICAEISGSSLFYQLYPQWWHEANPRNIFDWEFDMNTTLENYPESRKEPTDNFFIQMRYNFGLTFIQTMKNYSYDTERKSLYLSAHEELAAKDKVIDELERHLQDCYIRYADPIIPTHILVTIVARTAVVNMRIRAHHPRQYVDAGLSLPPEEHEKLFSWSLQAIQYDNLFFTNQALERFRWHSRQLMQYHPLIYLLTAIRSKRINRTKHNVDDVWRELDTLFSNRPEFNERKHVLHLAIGMLALRAWETYDEEIHKENRAYQPPKFIQRIRDTSPGTSSPKATYKERPPTSYPRTTASQYSQNHATTGTMGQQQQQQPQLLQQSNSGSSWNWQPAQGYGTMGIPIMTSGADLPQGNSELWAQWDQLCLNPDMPLNSTFGLTTFNALDGFFTPMGNP